MTTVGRAAQGMVEICCTYPIECVSAPRAPGRSAVLFCTRTHSAVSRSLRPRLPRVSPPGAARCDLPRSVAIARLALPT